MVRKMETILDNPTAPPATGKSERRRQAILDVAKELFQTQGYAATSMSEIAARMGGSKGTLYNYFRSKEELFAAFMVDMCQIGSNRVFDAIEAPVTGDLTKALVDLGVNFATFLFMPDTMSIHRLVVAESGRFPELGRIFYETGPKRGTENLTRFFADLIDAGRLPPQDPVEAARWFKELLLAGIYNLRLWGIITDPTPEEIRAHVEKSVAVFLKVVG
jgi:TetR/AcrR family transcriptional repressor of mexJK operon